VIDVDVVHADGGLAQAHLAFVGSADGDLLVGHGLGAAGLVDTDRVGHGSSGGWSGMGRAAGIAILPRTPGEDARSVRYSAACAVVRPLK
jgi:hypothetical protein